MLKDALKGKLSAKELNLLRRSFDVVGDIAIFEVPDELKKKEKLIGNTILELLSNVKVVAVEQGEHKGAFRRQVVLFSRLMLKSVITLLVLVLSACVLRPLSRQEKKCWLQVQVWEFILLCSQSIALLQK